MTDAAHLTPNLERQWQIERADRYADDWQETFADLYQPFLVPGMSILDVGSGRRPLIQPSARPPGAAYVGLDISEYELSQAPEGSYDSWLAVDLTDYQSDLFAEFDLIVSWQVFEHIDPLAVAVENCRQYLKDGGHMVALLSGRNAVFSWINKCVPERVGVWTMEKLLRRPPDSVFHAYYDSCTDADLRSLFASWTDQEIYPRYRGARYFNFSKAVKKMYLLYEDWAARSDRRNLATHYAIVTTR